MNSVDDEGRVFVPFDLRRDIIEPLRGLSAKLDEVAARLTEHTQGHEQRTAEAVRAALGERWEERKQALVRAAKLAGSILGGLVSLLAGLWGAGLWK